MTYLVSDDNLKLQHWLKHYIHNLGVWANQTRVILRMRPSASLVAANATIAVAVAAGVLPENIRQQHSPPSDAVKIALMNEHITSLDDEAWHIYADVDELFDYPCELLDERPGFFTCVVGKMWDQLSATFELRELKAEPDLTEQFPLQCRIRDHFPQMMPDKARACHAHLCRSYRSCHSF